MSTLPLAGGGGKKKENKKEYQEEILLMKASFITYYHYSLTTQFVSPSFSFTHSINCTLLHSLFRFISNCFASLLFSYFGFPPRLHAHPAFQSLKTASLPTFGHFHNNIAPRQQSSGLLRSIWKNPPSSIQNHRI